MSEKYMVCALWPDENSYHEESQVARVRAGKMARKYGVPIAVMREEAVTGSTRRKEWSLLYHVTTDGVKTLDRFRVYRHESILESDKEVGVQKRNNGAPRG